MRLGVGRQNPPSSPQKESNVCVVVARDGYCVQRFMRSDDIYTLNSRIDEYKIIVLPRVSAGAVSVQ